MSVCTSRILTFKTCFNIIKILQTNLFSPMLLFSFFFIHIHSLLLSSWWKTSLIQKSISTSIFCGSLWSFKKAQSIYLFFNITNCYRVKSLEFPVRWWFQSNRNIWYHVCDLVALVHPALDKNIIQRLQMLHHLDNPGPEEIFIRARTRSGGGICPITTSWS